MSEINEIDIQLFKEENMEGPEQCPTCRDKDWYCDWCKHSIYLAYDHYSEHGTYG